MQVVGDVLSPVVELEGAFKPAWLDAARTSQRLDKAQMTADYLGLRDVEQSVSGVCSREARAIGPTTVKLYATTSACP